MDKDEAIAFLQKHLLEWPASVAALQERCGPTPESWTWGLHLGSVETIVLVQIADYSWVELDVDTFITRDEWSFKEKLYMVCDREPIPGQLGLGRLLRENGELVGRHASSSLSFLREDLRAKVNSQFEIVDLIGHPVPERFKLTPKRDAVREILAAAEGNPTRIWIEDNLDTFFNEE